MISQMCALMRLTRYREYLASVVVTTLLGAAAGQGSFGWSLIIVLVANWLAVCFAFMINDVEDAADDALNPDKVQRNPVSSGHLSASSGRVASFTVGLCSAGLYMLLGPWPSLIGMVCLAIGFLYSWRRIRLKVIPVVDLVSHGMMLAGLQFLTAYFTFAPRFAGRWVYPFAFVVAISLYGQLFNELRDLEGDRRAGLKHTASMCGPRVACYVMLFFLLAGAGSGFITMFASSLMPIHVPLICIVLACILIAYRLARGGHGRATITLQALFHGRLEAAGAIALAIWFVEPWVGSLPPVGFVWRVVQSAASAYWPR